MKTVRAFVKLTKLHSPAAVHAKFNYDVQKPMGAREIMLQMHLNPTSGWVVATNATLSVVHSIHNSETSTQQYDSVQILRGTIHRCSEAPRDWLLDGQNGFLFPLPLPMVRRIIGYDWIMPELDDLEGPKPLMISQCSSEGIVELLDPNEGEKFRRERRVPEEMWLKFYSQLDDFFSES